MRILDIIKPLYEFAPPAAGAGSIELIKNLLSMVMNHELEGTAYKQAVDLLVDLETSAEAIEQDTTQPEQQPQQPVQQQPIPQQQQQLPVQEPVAQPEVPEEEPLAEAIRNHTKALNNLLARVNDPTKWATLIAAKRAKGVSDQDIYELLGSGMELQHQISVEWDDELEITAEILADKIVKNAEIIHSAIEANLKKDAGNKTEVAEAKIKAGTKEKASPMKGKIVAILKNVFEPPVRNQRELASREKKKLLVKQFMEQCKSGIIDFNDIIENNGAHSTIDQLVEKRDEEIYYEIRDEIFVAVPSTTAGAWGPGEVGLSLLATPVTKGSIGDLAVMTANGLVEVELKGMQSAKAGGRFNSNGVAKAKDAAKDFRKAINTAYDQLSEIIISGNGKQAIGDIGSTFRMVSNQKTGATKAKRPETFDLEAIDNIWNPKLVVPASRIDPVATQLIMTELLREMAEAAVLEEGKQFAQEPIDQMVRDVRSIFRAAEGEGFELNFLGIQANIAKILYSVYAGVDKKGVIMYFNTKTSNYYIVQGPQDMYNQIQKGKLQTGNAIIDFAAGQSPASPQVGIA
jgi:hypothetical protein